MRETLRWAMLVVTASLVLIRTRDAEAAASARLVYLRNPGAESCPDEAAIRAAVAARLGYDPFFPYAPATLHAEISREKSMYRASIKLVDDDNVVRGIRELTHKGDRCADIIAAMALSMSIALDPQSLMRPPQEGTEPPAPPSAPEPETPSKPEEPARPKEPSAAPAALAKEAMHLEGYLGPNLWLGAGPGPSVGGNLALRARVERFSLALEGRGDLPSSRTIGAATVETSLVFASLVPCIHLGWAHLCAVGSLGSVRATSRDVALPSEDSAFHAAAGGRVGVELAVASFASVSTHATGLVTFTPQRLQIDGQDFFTLPRFSAGIGLGMLFRFF